MVFNSMQPIIVRKSQKAEYRRCETARMLQIVGERGATTVSSFDNPRDPALQLIQLFSTDKFTIMEQILSEKKALKKREKAKKGVGDN